MSEHYDLCVIGAGPAGEKGAAQAAYFGKRVLVIEGERAPGGAAVHTGTLPSKTLRESALYLLGLSRARTCTASRSSSTREATLQRLMSRKNAIATPRSTPSATTSSAHPSTTCAGARSPGRRPHRQRRHPEGERRATADYILIATGSKPHRPADIDFADPFIHDSDEILTIEQMPTSMTILGGGVIGCE